MSKHLADTAIPPTLYVQSVWCIDETAQTMSLIGQHKAPLGNARARLLTEHNPAYRFVVTTERIGATGS